MEQDVNLNIPYSAPLYIWDKIGEVFASMPYWNGKEEGLRWTGPDIDLWASAESGGIQIAGTMPDEIWEKWYAALKEKLGNALDYEIGEPEDGAAFYQFIPKDIAQLYKALKKEQVKGELLLEDGWLIWRLPSGILLKIYVWSPMREGYIETYYLKKGGEVPLTHWHPAEEEVYQDLMDIDEGRTVWVKKKSLFGEEILMMNRKEYEAVSDKKRRYRLLE